MSCQKVTYSVCFHHSAEVLPPLPRYSFSPFPCPLTPPPLLRRSSFCKHYSLRLHRLVRHLSPLMRKMSAISQIRRFPSERSFLRPFQSPQPRSSVSSRLQHRQHRRLRWRPFPHQPSRPHSQHQSPLRPPRRSSNRCSRKSKGLKHRSRRSQLPRVLLAPQSHSRDRWCSAPLGAMSPRCKNSSSLVTICTLRPPGTMAC